MRKIASLEGTSKILVAYDQDRAIGLDGGLPWGNTIKDDLEHVHRTSRNQAMIMGRGTIWPNPDGKEDRFNRQLIVMTRHPETFHRVGAVAASSLDEAYSIVEPGRETIIFGGEDIFRLALEDRKKRVGKILATEIFTKSAEASAYFPELSDEWVETSREPHKADQNNKYDYDFVIFERK